VFGKGGFAAPFNPEEACAFDFANSGRLGEPIKPRERIGCAGYERAEDKKVGVQAVEHEVGKRDQIPAPDILHDCRARVQVMTRGSRPGLDPQESFIDFGPKPCLKSRRDRSILPGKPQDVLRKVRVIENLYPTALRYSSSVNPRTRPETISSMRRTPSATDSLTTRSVAMLSTIRRASSRRSLSDRARTDSEISCGIMIGS